jgi:hypothetical protein
MLNANSKLHNDMLSVVKSWIDQLPQDRKQKVLTGLTKDGVRQGLHHDDEKSKQEQQLFGKTQPQPTLPQLKSSARVINGLPGSTSTTTAIGSSSRGYSSGYSTSTYQTYSSQRSGASSGTSYAQGMMSDYTSTQTSGSGMKGTVEFRMWPYNMDYYTRQDDYSLKHLSPYYQSMPTYIQAPNLFTSGQITYVQSPSVTASSPSVNLTSNMGSSTGQGQQMSNAGMGLVQSPTNLTSASSTLPSSMFTPSGQGVGPQQTQFTTPLTSSQLSTLNAPLSPATTIPATIGTANPSLTAGLGPASSTGQGTNSSYYGQVTDHGQSSQPVSPTQTSAPLGQSTSPVQQVASMQNSLQNMNLNV